MKCGSRIQWLLLTAIALTLLTPSVSPADDIVKTDLFKVGDHGYNLYHIPGIAVTAKGTILAWCEARKNAGHDWDDIDILLRRSTDDGKTWSEAKKIVEILASIYEPLGYPTLAISASTDENLSELREQMKDKINLVAGYSGTGKSTLINKLQPELDLKTGDISSKTKKGKHITTFVEMFSLPFGGYIIDSPGMKEFKITDLRPEEISACFPEFRKLKGKCQFDNCFHFEEPKCAVKDAVESGDIAPNRYAHYLDILNAMQQVKEWE